jgi:hypothetical protein
MDIWDRPEYKIPMELQNVLKLRIWLLICFAGLSIMSPNFAGLSISGVNIARAEVNILHPFGYEPFYQEGSEQTHFISPHTLVSIFPSGIFGNETSGYSFGARLAPSDSKFISYEVKFPAEFDFVRGGKLPGLCGGKNASGGIVATGYNGFSARMMWRKDGRVVSYVYHVDQKTQYGDDFQWINSRKEALFFTKDRWHSIKFRVTLNNFGQKNGSIQGYFDGNLALIKTNLNFRATDAIQIDRLCFNTFFGGDDPTWAPKKDERLWIRNLKI